MEGIVVVVEEEEVEVEVEVALTRRLLAMYHDAFASSEGGGGGDNGVGVERYRQGVVGALGAMLSCSCGAKEYSLSVGFEGGVVGTLDELLRLLPLTHVEPQWTSDKRTTNSTSKHKLTAALVSTPAFAKSHFSAGSSKGGGGRGGRKGSVSSFASFRCDDDEEQV